MGSSKSINEASRGFEPRTGFRVQSADRYTTKPYDISAYFSLVPKCLAPHRDENPLERDRERERASEKERERETERERESLAACSPCSGHDLGFRVWFAGTT